MNALDLSEDLDRVDAAMELFVTEYTGKMSYPINFLSSVVSNMSKNDDALVTKANLETLSRTLAEMDRTLIALMNTLESSL